MSGKLFATLGFFLTIVFFLFGCQTTRQVPQRIAGTDLTELPEQKNQLSTGHLSLFLPTEWYMIGGRQVELLQFGNSNESINGVIQLFENLPSLAPEMFCRFLWYQAKNDYPDKQIVSLKIDGYDASIMHLVRGDGPHRSVTLTSLKVNDSFYLLEFSGPPEREQENQLRFEHISKGIKINEVPVEKRIRGRFIFFSHDQSWQWYADYRDGFFVAAKVEQKPVLLGICTAKPEERLLPDSTEIVKERLEAFQALLWINNRETLVQATGFISNHGGVYLFYHFYLDGEEYTCQAFVADGASAFAADKFHEQEQVRNFFLYNLKILSGSNK